MAAAVALGRHGSPPPAPLHTPTTNMIGRVAYHGGSSHFFGIGISRYQIQPVLVFFGRYYRGVGKISFSMIWLSKNI